MIQSRIQKIQSRIQMIQYRNTRSVPLAKMMDHLNPRLNLLNPRLNH